MGHPKCRDIDSIDFLIASPRTASCREAARSQPPRLVPPTHDAYTRLIQRLEPNPETLYTEVEPLVKKDDGVIVLDDSTLDHLDAKKIQAVQLALVGQTQAGRLGHQPDQRGLVRRRSDPAGGRSDLGQTGR